MILTSWVIGFHFLLLPTFVIELVPVLDDLPTWTACRLPSSPCANANNGHHRRRLNAGQTGH